MYYKKLTMLNITKATRVQKIENKKHSDIIRNVIFKKVWKKVRISW